MIESPLLQKMFAEKLQEVILDVLKDRFGTVPRDVTKLLRALIEEKKLRKLTVLAAKCPDLETFRGRTGHRLPARHRVAVQRRTVPFVHFGRHRRAGPAAVLPW